MAVTLSISIAQNSQNVTNNTSNVTVSVIAKWTQGSWNLVQKPGWVKIDGTTYDFNHGFNAGGYTTGSETLYTKTLNIPHNANGTKTLACSASYTTGVSSGTITATASKTLTTIPRKSTLSVSNGTLGTAQTLKITEQSSGFNHKLYYSCGSAPDEYILGSSTSTSSSLSISWTPPLDLARQNVVGTSVTIRFHLVTYSGSTSIGSYYYDRVFTIPASVKPTCTISVSDFDNLDAAYGGYIQNVSKLYIELAEAGLYGSTIKSRKITVDGKTYTKQPVTTSPVSTSGDVKITASITDSRGRTGTTSVTVHVLPYKTPCLTIGTPYRCDIDDGNIIANNSGSRIAVSFEGVIESLNGTNSADVAIQYKKKSDSEYIYYDYPVNTGTSTFSGLYTFPAELSSSYDVFIRIRDSIYYEGGGQFSSVSKVISVPASQRLWSIRPKGNGLALNKYAEVDGLFDIGFQTQFTGGIKNILLEPNTDLDDVKTPNTYIGDNVATNNYANCPFNSGTFTLEVTSGGDAGQVRQRITSCRKEDARTFERFFYTNAWGDWVCVSDFGGTLLWSGKFYMTETQVCDLAESVSRQRSGIVLVFAHYTPGEPDEAPFNWQCFFVPKLMLTLNTGSTGYTFELTRSKFSYVGNKYLYITDAQIKGNAANEETGTANGITYANNRFVLRYVIGV